MIILSFRLLLEGMGLNEDDLPAQMDTEKWVIKHCTIHIGLLSVFGYDSIYSSCHTA